MYCKFSGSRQTNPDEAATPATTEWRTTFRWWCLPGRIKLLECKLVY